MRPSLIKKIIFDYFDGNHTSIQRKMIEEWLQEPANNETFYHYLDEWESQNPQYVFDIENGLKSVYQRIDDQPDDVLIEAQESKTIRWYPIVKWLAAASLLMAMVWIGVSQLKPKSVVSYKILADQTKSKAGEIYEKINLTTEPILVNLPDNSSVLLQPKSKICYSPKLYNKDRREVILSGEAFFEVQKNPGKPFFVYANELITKVLGTSFSVKTVQASSEIEVIVKTGRVALFLQNDIHKQEKITGKSLTGFVLNANERVNINGLDYKIAKPTLVVKSSLTIPIQKLAFNFDDTPVSAVFEELEKAYMIQIVYDREKMANCKLTAHLSDEPLIEKLKLICIALEATYEQADTKLIIKSNGCK